MTNRQTQAQTVSERRIDIGAQVGIQRNLEFALGGRHRKLIPTAYESTRPALNPQLSLISAG